MADSSLKRSVKFVASDSDGMPMKRRQVQQACDSCRRRKKRCTHTSDSVYYQTNGPDGRILPQSPDSQDRQDGEDQDPDEASAEEVASHLVELSASRFVGDLNPEGIFVEATQRNPLYRDRADTGSWLPSASSRQQAVSRPRQEENIQSGRNGTERLNTQNVPSPMRLSGRQSLQPNNKDHVSRECLNILPPERDFQQLRAIFLERIQPIIPILNGADLHGEHPSKISGKVMKQVIALSAATDPSAAKHLRLVESEPILSFREFHRRLSSAIFTALDADLLENRVDHLRVLTMMAFFYQPSIVADRDMPSLIFSQAVHYAHTLGIHLMGYRPQRQDENIEQLFCAIWAMDRIMAAFYGRPCLIHDRDIDRDLDNCIRKQESCFRLFLRVVQSLDRVFELYRPRNNFQPVDMPVFEAMVLDAGAERLPPRLLATIEVLYHAISVLSCRQPSSAFGPSARESDHLPHPILNARRSLSADRIIQVVFPSYFPSPMSPSPHSEEDICILPFIPYAVVLSLTVSYRKMRYSKVPMYRTRGKVVFKEIVALLKMLGTVYTCARVNASMGESILREMDKTAKELANTATPLNNGIGSRRRSPVGTGSNANGQAHHQTINDNGMSAAETRAEGLNGVLPCVGQVAQPHFSQNPEGGSAPLEPESTVLGDLSDIDLFGYFDPGFDLGAVDAALEANLDMGFPQTWTTQWRY